MWINPLCESYDHNKVDLIHAILKNKPFRGLE